MVTKICGDRDPVRILGIVTLDNQVLGLDLDGDLTHLQLLMRE